MNKELQLSMLGKLEINQGGAPVTGFVSTKAQALLCYLAVTGRSYDRQLLARLLWGNMPETEARSNLRMALSNLRKLLEPYLIITRQTVVFNRDSPYWLDVEVFEATLATSAPEKGLQLARHAVELYRGDFMEGFGVREALAFEEWMLDQRERLRQLVGQALHALAVQHTERGEYATGIDYTTRLLALEPWREEAHRQLMILLAKSGQRSAALAQYDTCRRLLVEELGMEPMPETVALYERIKATGAPRPHNLPPQTTPFVGREVELSRIAGYLGNPACRLLTLAGPGGIGKTRLALQAATEQLPAFQDGIFLVPLAAVNSAELLVPTIATALNFSLSGPVEPKTQLLHYLSQRKMLLMLDNFEHLLAGIDLLADIFREAPHVKVLVTSQERLNLREEWVMEIEGLNFPDEDWKMSKTAQSFDPPLRSQDRSPIPNYQTYSAVAFFVQQAQRVQANFALSTANQEAVVRLCRLVNGMPLGLELAATWVPMLSAAEIVAEIERDLDFLATSLRNVPERHRSMRAVFESAWHLLLEDERRVLKRLSVFRGGFQREAAIQVTGASLPLLLALLNKSLLRRDASGRYDMHNLIRQYAAEKLAQSPPEREQTEDRYCVYYAGLMQQKSKLLFSPQQLETLREIRLELENVQAAWQRAVEQQQIELVDQLVKSLWFFYTMQGRYHEGIETFNRAIEWLEQDTSAREARTWVYAHLLARQGDLYFGLARFEPAKALSQQSLSLLQSLDAPGEAGFVLTSLGLVAWHQGEYAEARQYFKESLAQGQAGGDSWVAGISLSLLGAVAYALGEYAEAEQLLRQSLLILREIDKMWGLVTTLIRLSSVLSALGRAAEAGQLLQEGLAVSREMGDRWGIASCLSRLGRNLNQMGEAERLEARRLLQESVALFREIGDGWGLANALNRLGQTSCALGQYQAARRYLREALQVASDSQTRPVTLDVLVNLADFRLRLATTEPDLSESQAAALELLTLVRSHPASQQTTKDRAARLAVELEANLPRSVVEAALERGQTKSLEVAAAQLLVQPWLRS